MPNIPNLLDRYDIKRIPNQYDILSKYKSFNAPKNDVSTPLVGSSNTRSTLLSRQNQINQGINDLFAKKYGLDRYDSSLGWNGQTGSVISSWNDAQEAQALNEYNKLIQDLQATNNALNEHDSIIENKQVSNAEQSVIKDQAEKYLPQEQRAVGLGAVGTSESSKVGIVNDYARNVSEINKNAQDADNNLLKMYNNDVLTREGELVSAQKDTLNEYQDVAYNDAYQLMQQSSSPEDLDKIILNAKGNISDAQYVNLSQLAEQMKNNPAWKYTWSGKAYETEEMVDSDTSIKTASGKSYNSTRGWGHRDSYTTNKLSDGNQYFVPSTDMEGMDGPIGEANIKNLIEKTIENGNVLSDEDVLNIMGKYINTSNKVAMYHYILDLNSDKFGFDSTGLK